MSLYQFTLSNRSTVTMNKTIYNTSTSVFKSWRKRWMFNVVVTKIFENWWKRKKEMSKLHCIRTSTAHKYCLTESWRGILFYLIIHSPDLIRILIFIFMLKSFTSLLKLKSFPICVVLLSCVYDCTKRANVCPEDLMWIQQISNEHRREKTRKKTLDWCISERKSDQKRRREEN